MTDKLDYGNMMHRAMRSLIADVLGVVSREGLPGEHHFFITFDTRHPDVGLSDWLRERYPDEMTIVLQHWFEDLEVNEQRFSITLNFGDQPETLIVPLDAILTFVDPSVEFGLRFESHDEDGEESKSIEDVVAPQPVEAEVTPLPTDAEHPEHEQDGDAEVVSLDSFRK